MDSLRIVSIAQDKIHIGANASCIKKLLYKEIKKEVENGADGFLIGLDSEFGILAVNCISMWNRLHANKKVPVTAIISYEGQQRKWCNSNVKYKRALNGCDEIITLFDDYRHGCYREAARFLVDNTYCLICYDDASLDSYLIKYAKRCFGKIINLYNVN